jgi:succinate-acetate transporter protein
MAKHDFAGNNVADVEQAQNENINPSPEEVILLRRLRTLQGNDYEAQYFDNKQIPRGDAYKKMGNPSSLGISVFAVTNTMIALYLMQVRGIQHTNLLVGMLWFTGGVASWLTCIFEVLLGNTFAYCVFGSLGGYYFAFACTLTPSFQIASGYSDAAEYSNALGVFFCVWASLFFIFLLASMKTNLIFVWIFTMVDITAWLLAGAYFRSAAGNAVTAAALQKAGGAFLFACSMGSWYLLIIQLTEAVEFGFKFPIGALSKPKDLAERASQPLKE